MQTNNDVPFTSYTDLLNSDAVPEQSGSQETHNSSQGFISNLANDEELFGDIKPDEDLSRIFQAPTPSLQIPLSPGSTVSVDSMETFPETLTDSKEAYSSVVKEEIKTKLMMRQMHRGIDPDDSTAPWRTRKTVHEQKSPEALLRIEDRKLKNRIAARKCRMKKRRSEELLKEDLARLTQENNGLRNKVAANKREYERLMTMLSSHACVFTRPASPDL